ncbi:PREDICTED: uncharacterized protein LOC108765739 [Trachymyrmex cornetzi]|uniref:uncharacterized protein LOC108765739 n=1 Tax=Trachymyrmex cornetzi TaxID=471704 RepID=UPI00084F4EA1|nr:PREDICTED: uncharacterized protein LOC108765739 [Trachymyrmex cornetzi]
MEDKEAETVAKAFYESWICRFGAPLRVMTDQGRQFESQLFRRLGELTDGGAADCVTGDPSGLERGLAGNCGRARIREAALRLPGQFLSQQSKQKSDAVGFVKELKEHFNELRPVDGTRHGEYRTFIFRDLATSGQVFVRQDAQRAMLQAPYDGPYAVVGRAEKTLVVLVHGKEVTVSIDRVKPAYILTEDVPDDGAPGLDVERQDQEATSRERVKETTRGESQPRRTTRQESKISRAFPGRPAMSDGWTSQPRTQ